ncbi:MAG: DUF1080 domain-containing protein, partial [Verrucomicrobia bacterium]|nr:DUF1080 domain-containing protein [Verrucomicrobiota bacterium]
MKIKSLLPIVRTAGTVAVLAACLTVSGQSKVENPFVGRWALTIPGGGAGWLGVTQEKGFYDASILWGGGSVVPVSSVFFDENLENMFVVRNREVERKDNDGKVIRKQEFPEMIVARIEGETLRLIQLNPDRDGIGIAKAEFNGNRIPPLPPKPDLSSLEYGKPIKLFNERNLEGWELTNPRQVNGWSVKNGVLINRPTQEEGKPHISYGNLKTKSKFEDFNLKLEVNVPENGNSGVYLRGIYEVQVADSYGKSTDSHNMGAVYSRITPSVSAEKPPGQWQSLDITLVDRHVTVILNGTKIIDNKPLLGCTGGALWSDEFRPGPIYLQGD